LTKSHTTAVLRTNRSDLLDLVTQLEGGLRPPQIEESEDFYRGYARGIWFACYFIEKSHLSGPGKPDKSPLRLVIHNTKK
jgi:hypothetical protein